MSTIQQSPNQLTWRPCLLVSMTNCITKRIPSRLCRFHPSPAVQSAWLTDYVLRLCSKLCQDSANPSQTQRIGRWLKQSWMLSDFCWMLDWTGAPALSNWCGELMTMQLL